MNKSLIQNFGNDTTLKHFQSCICNFYNVKLKLLNGHFKHKLNGMNGNNSFT